MASDARGGGVAATALAEPRDLSFLDVTAASYGTGWLRFCEFCAEGSYRALPAAPSTDGRYVAFLWLKGAVQPTSARTYLAAVRKRHIAAGYANPCVADVVSKALAGFSNEWLRILGAKLQRVALPAPFACTLAQLAYASPSATVRLRLTAVVRHFFMCRRAKDVLALAAADIALTPARGLSFQILRTKTDAKRPGDERRAHSYPPSSFTTVPDRPILLLRRALAVHHRHLRPSDRLFWWTGSDPGSALSALLRAGLLLLGASTPVGCVYASHSCRSGGCTAMRTICVGLDTIAQWAGMSVETLTKSYNDALAPVTPEAHFFFSRLIPRVFALPA